MLGSDSNEAVCNAFIPFAFAFAFHLSASISLSINIASRINADCIAGLGVGWHEEALEGNGRRSFCFAGDAGQGREGNGICTFRKLFVLLLFQFSRFFFLKYSTFFYFICEIYVRISSGLFVLHCWYRS